MCCNTATSEKPEAPQWRLPRHKTEPFCRKKDDFEVDIFSKCGYLLVFSESDKFSDRPETAQNGY